MQTSSGILTLDKGGNWYSMDNLACMALPVVLLSLSVAVFSHCQSLVCFVLLTGLAA